MSLKAIKRIYLCSEQFGNVYDYRIARPFWKFLKCAPLWEFRKWPRDSGIVRAYFGDTLPLRLKFYILPFKDYNNGFVTLKQQHAS